MVDFIQSHRVRFYLLPFIGGVLYALGFPNKLSIQFMGFSFLGVFLLLSTFQLSYRKVIHKLQLKRELLSLLAFSVGYCLMGYYWVPYTLNQFGGIVFPFNFILGLSFSFIIIPQILMFLLLHNFITKLSLKSTSFTKSIALKNLLYAFIFSFLEYIIPQQFPAHLGHTWLQLAPYIGLTPFVGAPVFSFFSYWLIFSFIGMARTGVKDYLGFGSFLAFFLLNLLIPLNPLTPDTKEITTNIRMVQANIGNFLKLDSESGSVGSIQEIYERYYRMSISPTNFKLDLIIWPETAFPRSINSSHLKSMRFPSPTLFQKVTQKMNTEVLSGGYDRNSTLGTRFESEYNSAFLFSSEGKLKDVYHKMILIPFGESLPFGPLNKYLAKAIDNIAYFAKGQNYTEFKLENGSRFIAAICYEILFSNFIRDYLNSIENDPHFLVNITNDSWYGDTAEPFQHLFLAKWRALEFNIPIVRMTNTGISSVIYPTGRESKRTGVLKQENLDIKLVTPLRSKTVFQKYGILVLWGLFFFFVILQNLIIYYKSKN